MVREGTRSQTGNSRPRVFSVPDTAPVQKRRSSKAKAAPDGGVPGAGRKPGPKKSAAGAAGKAAGGVVKKAKKGTAAKTATKPPVLEGPVKADTKVAEKKVAGAVKAAEKIHFQHMADTTQEVKPDEEKADGAAAAEAKE
ncbi:Copalyl diphosphate synthase-like protein [Purpureocillium lavendulum]|uniref:Copalyl diphosphate synthase-like protein n=1 Tax=Purpureocillium lavendulum TaxID=1247861 RepID=A0AB34FIX0_9HYPO|nr:Copalyl diphosphate synthase-like protein [Purpureocillium lavendulum]